LPFAARWIRDLSAGIQSLLVVLKLMAVLRRSEPKAMDLRAAGSSSNKRPFLCRFHAEGHAFKIPSSGHGVLERVDPWVAAG
jgi:hypothetical protein